MVTGILRIVLAAALSCAALLSAFACSMPATRARTDPLATFSARAQCEERLGRECAFGCPPWMASRRVGDREVCIDYYELPPGSRLVPRTPLAWKEAEAACEVFGKRLCTVEEWSVGCQGTDARHCNCSNPVQLKPATAFPRCKSEARVFEMPCNADEWTSTPGPETGTHIAMTGFENGMTACKAGKAKGDSSKTANLGTRCCMTPMWFAPP